jgi:acetyl-CoA carboxylase biotin carboxylase subunit
MHEAAVSFGRHLSYRGLGTVELLYDVERENFYFLEMNARIQVEHPVTEAITGLDLVAAQIAIAEGRGLPVDQRDVAFRGHAIECRVNAESIDRDFQPSPGVARTVWFPSGLDIRVDTHMQSGSRVPPFYDSMIAKIITRGETREAAIARMRHAIDAARIEGIDTNLALHARVLAHPDFQRGGVDTGFLAALLEPGEATRDGAREG